MKIVLPFLLLAALICGCVTNQPFPGSPQVFIHAPEDAVKNHVVNDLVNRGWSPVSDSQFTISLDKAGGFWENVFFGSQWNRQTVTRMTLTFISLDASTRVIYHAAILTNPGSGFQQQVEVNSDWPRVQFWLDCMSADLENRPRPPTPVYPPPKPLKPSRS